MSREPIHPRLAGATPPAPPERLRPAVLGAAERSWGSGRDLWSRAWESRPLRLAWAATLAALLAAHLLLPGPAPRSGPGATLAARGGPGLAELVDPIPLRLAPLAWLGEGLSESAVERTETDPDRGTS